jgi:hypothetical protein
MQIAAIISNREKSCKLDFVIQRKRYLVFKTARVDKKFFAGGYDYSKKKHCIVKVSPSFSDGAFRPVTESDE